MLSMREIFSRVSISSIDSVSVLSQWPWCPNLSQKSQVKYSKLSTSKICKFFFFHGKSNLDPASLSKFWSQILYRNCIWRSKIRKETFFVYRVLHNSTSLVWKFWLKLCSIHFRFVSNFSPEIQTSKFALERQLCIGKIRMKTFCD